MNNIRCDLSCCVLRCSDFTHSPDHTSEPNTRSLSAAEQSLSSNYEENSDPTMKTQPGGLKTQRVIKCISIWKWGALIRVQYLRLQRQQLSSNQQHDWTTQECQALLKTVVLLGGRRHTGFRNRQVFLKGRVGAPGKPRRRLTEQRRGLEVSRAADKDRSDWSDYLYCLKD